MEWNILCLNFLKALGLSVQLNHRGWSCCPNPEICTQFTVINVDAIHSIQVNFCVCGQGTQSRHIQLLCVGLFPITSEDPKTAVTFWTLELFEILSYESKVSIFEYHHMLTHLTDNMGISRPPVTLIILLIDVWLIQGVGPIFSLQPHHSCMVSPQNVEKGGKRTWPWGCGKHKTRGMCTTLSCLSPAWYQPTWWMGNGQTR